MARKTSYEVKEEFVRFLEQEKLISKKDKIDSILANYSGRAGGLIPVLQQVQNELRYLPSIAQEYIALGLNVPASNVFGVVSFILSLPQNQEASTLSRSASAQRVMCRAGKRSLKILKRV